ncbi:EutN/CcmL family microcompartment protein [Stratiformator vulcanicus]|uniref:Ethanolamine utilization protein EutN/carboxysome n=1 Tax=Stratiformator vulcanicus TaxID=2527980 RepID=A0A517QXZ6_9PLAN|nr:EutN/CcmL family microcompartment protein [Stratiformator vulcanicus]QDT36484.1 Ethanolamine utilization protein EutN/carboxysome [Stratiformator vulcanicus]
MKIGEIIGTVTLATAHPDLSTGRWRLVAPLDRRGLNGDSAGRGEPFALYDELGADLGSLVAIAEGPEAAAPFQPAIKPIDAYNAAILDAIEIDS